MNLACNANGQGKFSLIFIEPVNSLEKTEKGRYTLCSSRREFMPRKIVEFSLVRIPGDGVEVYKISYLSR